jgi:hypothetical protein
VSPTSGADLPAAHEVQDVPPDELEYLPTLHAVHDDLALPFV